MIAIIATTAMAGTLLSGCAMNSAPRADVAANKAQHALAEGNTGRAINNAEEAVRVAPRNASYRAMLGNAYLNAGRFRSAETAFNDAMTLGDNSPRTALSLALAMTAQGQYEQAAALLNDWKKEIAPADLGLALGLADHPNEGIRIMESAIRSGNDTVKMRQNLAYTYALAGRWRQARLMAEQDVPADKVSDRIAKWAQLNSANEYETRVATLLNVPAGVHDRGEPTALALANTPGAAQLASEASAYAAKSQADAAKGTQVAVASKSSELPAKADKPGVSLKDYPAQQTAKPQTLAQAFATSAPSGGSMAQVTGDSLRFVSNPVVETLPARHGAMPEGRAVARGDTHSTARAAPMLADASGSHLVQLGSFFSEQGARRAWGIYVTRYPELSRHKMVITQAVVRGKHYWRVSAGGYTQVASRAMCQRVDNAHGDGCIAWAASKPLPGAINTDVRMAMR